MNKSKYIKYKNKYLTLKKLLGGKTGNKAQYEYEVYLYSNKRLSY